MLLPHGVAGEGGDLGHAGISPHDDLVKGVPVRAHDLVDILRPHQVAHLFFIEGGMEGGGGAGLLGETTQGGVRASSAAVRHDANTIEHGK